MDRSIVVLGGALLLGAAAGWLAGRGDRVTTVIESDGFVRADAGELARLEAENARLREALAEAQRDPLTTPDPDPTAPRPPGLEPAPGPGTRPPPTHESAEQGLLRQADIDFVQQRGRFRLQGPAVDIPKGLEGTPEMWIEAIRIGLEGPRPGLVQHAQFALQALGERGAESLTRAFADEGASDTFRAHILGALTLADPARSAAVAAWWLAADRTPSALRSAVLKHYAASKPTSMPGGVRNVLNDPDAPEADVTNALRILMSADPSAALARLRAMVYGRDPTEQGLAYQLLQGTQDPAYRGLILEVVRDASPGFQKHFVTALAAMKGLGWGRVQMIGEPDTFGGGDQRTAWASKKGEEGHVTVELDFPTAVRAEQVRVHETFNPGAIIRVEGRGPGSDWVLLWAGEPQATSAPRWFAPKLAEVVNPISSVRLTLDTNAVKGWN
jgi:hypothetical protein